MKRSENVGGDLSLMQSEDRLSVPQSNEGESTKLVLKKIKKRVKKKSIEQ